MRLYIIDTGFFKLDGGAMFGIVPQVLWKKLNPPDEKNLCTWAMRCLLIEDGDTLMLVDTGLGDKQDDKFRSHFEPHGKASLLGSLKEHGFSPDDITDVFLTHLHFDHCGGAIRKDTSGKYVPTFRNARYWSSSRHWAWATDPNPREKASFLQENILPISDSGRLVYTETAELPLEDLEVEYVNGHTEAMQLLHIPYKDRTIVYAADLIPSRHHVRMPYIMAYDVRPLDTLKEKKIVLERAVENDQILLFEHDPEVECCSLKRTDKGIEVDETFRLDEI